MNEYVEASLVSEESPLKDHIQSLWYWANELGLQENVNSESAQQSLPKVHWQMAFSRPTSKQNYFCVDFSFCCFAINPIDFSLKQNIIRLVWQTTLDVTNSFLETVIFSPKEMLGILDLRSIGYYKIKQGILQHNLSK